MKSYQEISTSSSDPYEKICAELEFYLNDNLITNLANTAALLYHNIPNINWAGFYLLENTKLVLGPFQGLPACMEIQLGRGVCGKSAAENKIIRVDNVHEFPGHIACDSLSRSEIVLPLHKGRLIGVLDVDSPDIGRFTQKDVKGLQKIVEILLARTPFL